MFSETHTHTDPLSTSGLQSEPCEHLLPSSHPHAHKALFIRAGGGERQGWKKKKAPTLTPKPAAQWASECIPPPSTGPWCCSWGVLIYGNFIGSKKDNDAPHREALLGEDATWWPLRKVKTPGHWQSLMKFNNSMAKDKRKGDVGRRGKDRGRDMLINLLLITSFNIPNFKHETTEASCGSVTWINTNMWVNTHSAFLSLSLRLTACVLF